MEPGEIRRQEASVDTQGQVRVTIPAEHIVQPGLRFWWEVLLKDRVVTTEEQIVYYFDQTDQVQWDKRIAEAIATGSSTVLGYDVQFHGTLPCGNPLAYGTAILPLTEPPEHAPVTSTLLELRTTGSTPHRGVDFSVYERPVRAMESGVVAAAGPTGDSRGTWVSISHGDGAYFSQYLHLKTDSLTVSLQDNVSKGQGIATSGATGGVPYHLDVRFVYYVGGQLRVLYPFKYFVGDIAGYNASRDFDIVQAPSTSYDNYWGTFVQVNAYPRGTTDGE